MKIQILSYTHNEFLTGLAKTAINHKARGNEWTGQTPETDADLIILAGDIDVGIKGVEWAIEESNILNVPIIYVAGNHEYYGSEYYSTLKKMRDTASGTNVHFLENKEILFEDIRILGCTLWTDYNVVPHLDAPQVMNECAYALNDHSVIRIGDDGYFTPEHASKIHSESVKWLRSKLNEKTEARATVVVTHHGPSSLCQHINYPVTAISAAFHSNLNELVSKANCWVYGHTHSNLDVMVGNCRLVSNQPGYPSEDIFDFNANKVIEI